MAAEKCEVTRCGLCCFFSHEGRRGGACNQLSVNVGAQWAACSLAVSPFASKPKPVMGIADWAPVASVQEAPLHSLSQSISSRSEEAVVSSATPQLVPTST